MKSLLYFLSRKAFKPAVKGALLSVNYLIYVSQARGSLDEPALEAILSESRAYNPAHGITGILLYAGRANQNGSFMQLLEGEKEKVEHLRDRIFSDPRHHTKIVLQSGAKEQRHFSDWSMAFRSADREALASYPKFSRLGEPEFLREAAEGRVSGSLEFLVEFWEDA